MKNKAFGTKRDPSLWARLVNERFGSDQPILSPEESIRAAKKLYRHAMGKSFTGPIKLTSGNRNTWVRNGVLYVNPDEVRTNRGLREMIHSISHYCHSRLHPKDAPHSKRQAALEGRLAKFALTKGFADGALKREAPAPKAKPPLIQQRYARIVNRRDKYKAEIERATRLLAKAEREVREYERRHGEKLSVDYVPEPKEPKEPTKRVSLKQRAETLAASLGVEIERDDGLPSKPWFVSHPALIDTPDDPHLGDHYVYSWREVMERVQEYAEVLNK